MQNKEQALRQIEDICATLHNNIKAVISGKFMMAVGLFVMGIPLMEVLFSHALDPMLKSVLGSYTYIGAFIARTIIYWSLALVLGKLFDTKDKSHTLVEKVFQTGSWMPIIALATAAALGITGYDGLIAPIILILVGCFFMFYGQLTPKVVGIAARGLIMGGIIGILLTAYAISNLWIYLVIYEGLVFFLMGYILHTKHNNA